MSTRKRDTTGRTVPPEHIDKVDEICDAFDAAWFAGQEPRIEDFVADAHQAYRSYLLQELLVSEWDLRQQKGQPVEVKAYEKRFPRDKDLIADVRGKWHPACESQFSPAGDAAATQPDATAKRLGHFELMEVLGRGSFGTVWKARDTRLDRMVAVKIPRHEKLAPSEIEQFLREARAAAQLNHPNIIGVHEVSREDDTLFIVSDLVDGVSLSQRLTARRPTAREAAQLCATLADALHHAHEAGVIHRDLKPHNIILDAGNEPHLTDFGMARRQTAEATVTMKGDVLGTPAYMSPEQALGESHQADRRTDIYSLGVILFQLLTGQLPFQGDSRILLHKIISDEPRRPRKYNPDLPRDLETICLKCLEKDPHRRYSTAQELAEDLRRYLRGEPIQARPVARAERAWRWCRRNPIPATLALVVLGLAIAGPIIALTQMRLRLIADSATARATEERLRADQRAYVSDMNLAALAWEEGDLARARSLLRRHDPAGSDRLSPTTAGSVDLRGFEWRLLWGLVNDDQTTMKLERLPVTVTCAALTPKAEYLAWGGADGSVHITDLIARQENIVLRENSSQTSCLAFSTDGRWLASGFADGTIQLWAVDRWDKKEVLAGHSGAIRHLVFHPDAAHLTSIGTDATIRMWNLKDTGETQAIDHPEPKAPNISISSNAKTVATFGGLDNTVRFWQLPEESGDKRYVKLHTLPPQKGIILSVALSTDGSTAIISTHDSLVSRWEIATLKHLAASSHTVLVNPLALSADGQTLVTARSDNLLKVWDVQTGHEIRTLRGHASTPSQLAISADGQSLASVDSDNTVRVWATGAGEERNRLLHQGIVVFLAVSPDGHTLATSDPNFFKVKLWNLSTRKSIDFFAGERTGHVAFSPDGKWFALLSSGGQLRLWDRSTTPYGSGPSADIGSFAVGNHLTFSHDSKILGFRNRQDEVVVLWDVSARAIMGTLPDNSGSVGAMAFAPTDEVIATASEEKIRLWDVASQRLLAAIPDQHPDTRSICFSPDGQLLAATSGDTELRWWDVSVPAQPHALAPLRGHTAHIVAVAFSPDGKTLATGGWDSTLRLWNVSSKQQVAILRDHSSVVQSLAWSPDGNTIYTGSGDASVRIWRAPSWEQIEAAEQIPASLAVRD